MMRRRYFAKVSKLLAVVASGGVLVLAEPSHGAESLKESWYMYRGRENMKINNNKAAIEAYEKAAEINPGNREAAHDLGVAYEKQGIADKAVNQYDSYLSKWPDDSEVALRQARLLKWSRYSYRQQDSIKYYRMALKEKDDPRVRLEYADTLASKKDSSAQAIREYQAVLKRQPHNAAAHRGLAKAYAWNGDQDQALYHSRLAKSYGGGGSDVRGLEASLEKDRRPELSGDARILGQSSTQDFDLAAVSLGAGGKFHPTPFTTATVHGGMEKFWNDVKSASGAYAGAGGQYRLSPDRSLNADFTYHTSVTDPFEFAAHFDWLSDESHPLSVGFKRELIYDSYMAVAGDKVAGKILGAARKNYAYFRYETTLFGKISAEVMPYAGWVSAQSVSPNAVFGGDLVLSLPLGDDAENGWSLIGRTQVASYQKDHSALVDRSSAPFAGGYFSPGLFLNQEALARYASAKSDTDTWSVAAGPAIQYVGGTTSNGVKLGGKLELAWLNQLGADLFLQLQGEAAKVGDAYTRAQVGASLIYRF